MARKRKLNTSTHQVAVGRVKRAKFTVDNIRFPEPSIDGLVLATGCGDVGQLGLGPDVLEKTRPVLVKLEDKIIDVVAGGMHTVCLTKKGTVITYGCNDEGALGRPTEGIEDAECIPAKVDLPGKIVQISAGDSHTAALLDDGRVFAWGTFRDSHGNMGLTVNGNERLPYEIIKEQKVVKIASGADHLVFLTNFGEVWTCGCAEQGQLGRITKRGSDRDSRTGGIGKTSIAKFVDPSPITLKPTLKLHFEDIWTGTYCTYAKVADSDDIYVFGLNNYHQIGLPITDPEYSPKLSKDFSKYKWKSVVGGQHHALGLTIEGKVYAIGRKEYGRLGLGKNTDDAQELTEVKGLADKKIETIGCGSSTSFAAASDGTIYSWGMGTGGPLGLGEEEDVFEPTPIKSKQLVDKKCIKVSGGGQHTVFLCTLINNNQNGDQ